MKLIIDVKVSDLDRSVVFYRDTLGFTCRTVQQDWAAILVGEAELHLYLHGGVTGHVEFYIDDIDTKVAELAARGVQFISGMSKAAAIEVSENMVTRFPWGRTAFFKDSEGNELALAEDF
jgi:predicted enzyme related to lactoylglutathione lyase